jgi:NADPH:quinone reductase-like Zn-dependent oxidoreductase
MKAAVIYEAGGPEALKLETRPIPKPTTEQVTTEQVLIRIKAFGLNPSSELFTRQGHSPGVPSLPRILGAIPEMLQTAWGSLFKALPLVKGDILLVRRGTASVGLAAAAIAKIMGHT